MDFEETQIEQLLTSNRLSKEFLQDLSGLNRVQAEVDYLGQLVLRGRRAKTQFSLTQSRECPSHDLVARSIGLGCGQLAPQDLSRLQISLDCRWSSENRIQLERRGARLFIHAGNPAETKYWTNLLNYTIVSPLPDRFQVQLTKAKPSQSSSAPQTPKPDEPPKVVIEGPTQFKKLTLAEIDWGVPEEPIKKKRTRATFRIKRDHSQGPRDGFQRNGFLTRSFKMFGNRKSPANSPVPLRRNRDGSFKERRESMLESFLNRHVHHGNREIKQKYMKDRPVFGNELDLIKKFVGGSPLEANVPDFLVRAIKKIEAMKWTEGLYRVPGENHKVASLSQDVDNFKYDSLDGCKDVHILTSAVKMFFRDLKYPLIPIEARDFLVETTTKDKDDEIVDLLRQGFFKLDLVRRCTLVYFLAHLRKVAASAETKMTFNALGTVVSPNMFHSVTEARRPPSLISELEENNAMVEILLNYYDVLADKAL